MKKTLSSLVATAIFILGGQIVSAQDTKLTPDQIIPAGVDAYYEFNTSNDNPFEEWILTELKNELDLFNESEEAKTKALELFADNTITLAMNLEDDMDTETDVPNMYATFQLTEEDFDYFVNIVSDKLAVNEYNGVTFYSYHEEYNFVYLENFVITTNNITGMEKIINNQLTESNKNLSDVKTYQNSRQNEVESPFLFMYIDPEFVADETFANIDQLNSGLFMDPTLIDQDLIKAILGESISVTQTEHGFDYGIYIKGDEEKLTELDHLFDKFNFTPSLYKKVSGNGIILYSEQYNLTESMNQVMEVLSEDSDFMEIYTEFTDWFNEVTDLDFDAEVLPLFTSNYLFAMHENNQVIPAITMIFQVRTDYSTMIDMLADLNNHLKTTFEDEEAAKGMNFYSYKVARIGGASFYQHEFDLSMLMDKDAVQTDQKLTLSFGYTNGHLVISTHNNLSAVYKADKGMTTNKNFDRLFTDRTDEISKIMYFDIDNLTTWLDEMLVLTNASLDMIDFMDELLAPWHSFYSKGYSTAATNWITGEIKVDVEQFAIYETLFEDLFGGYDNEYEYEYPEVLPVDVDYCDVSVNDWYYVYVSDLTSAEIISGYENGCFGPNNEVTRAEFTKMVLGAAEWNGLYVPVAMSDSDIYFNDVPNNEWYWHYVNQATANGFVSGYEDKTFKPNSQISRSEAVQILYNASPYLQDYNGAEPFTDVNKEDWFYTAVSAAFNADLVNGATPTSFEPNRNLTRAEASKIVSNFMYL